MTETAPISFTDAAAAKVKELRDDEGNPQLKLRVYITGGGCAGFSYGFTFDEAVNDDDTIVEKEGVTLLVDAMSIQYLDGSQVDYEKGLMGSRFVVSNPNAATTFPFRAFLPRRTPDLLAPPSTQQARPPA